MRLTITLLLALSSSALAGSDFAFVILSDRTGSHVDGIHEQIILKSQSEDAALYVSVGDHIEGYGSDNDFTNAEWDEYLSIVKPIKTDVYFTPGNHDIWDDESEAIWRDRIGQEPNYSFDYEGVHFVILDTSRWDSSDELPDDYIEWLKTDLAAHKDDRLTFVLFHKPLWYEKVPEGKGDVLHESFKENGVDAVINGHFHTLLYGEYDDIDYLIMGSSGGGIYGEDIEQGRFFQYGLVEVTGDDFDVTIVPLEGNERYPGDLVLIDDAKFLDKIYDEYVTVPEFFVTDNGIDDEVTISVTVDNIHEEAIDTEIVWDTSGTDWDIRPITATETIDANTMGGFRFDAKYENLYPLPKAFMQYPNAGGKLFDIELVPQATRTVNVRRLSGITIDGTIGLTEWDEAELTTDFCSPEGSASIIEGTRFLFGYDKENLYVAASCDHTEMEKLAAVAVEHDDAVYRDDCVGFFFSPGGLEGDVYQIYINPNGSVFDQRIFVTESGDIDGDTDWNGEYEIATTKYDDSWEIEIAIPFAILGTEPPQTDDEWRLNFRRKEIYMESSADWQYPISYEPKYYGRAIFE